MPEFGSLADYLTCHADAKLNPGPSRGDQRAGPEQVPPCTLRFQAVPLELDELDPSLIRQQVGPLALTEILPAEPDLAALVVEPPRVVDDDERADLGPQRQEVDRHSRVEEAGLTGLQHPGQHLGLPAS